MASPGVGRARLLAAVALAAAAWALWHFWPSEQRRVRQRLDALATVINEQPRDGAALVARTARLADFFEHDVVIDPGRGAGPIHGRERLLALASRLPGGREAFRLEFVDVSTEISGSRATAHLTAMLSYGDSRSGEGEDTVDAREVRVELRRTDDWRIARIVAVDTLGRPES